MSDNSQPPVTEAVVSFACEGRATGKMRNELRVTMERPFAEGPWELATDEGAFHGGEASAPPPLALFVAGWSGCIMTQIRAFARRLGVRLNDLQVGVRAEWDWQATGRTYETAPRGFSIDIQIDSPDPLERQRALVEAARKGCFIEQTLGRGNTVRHRLKTEDGWIEA